MRIFVFHETKHFMGGKLYRYSFMPGTWHGTSLAHGSRIITIRRFFRFVPGELGSVTKAARETFSLWFTPKALWWAWRIFQALHICVGNLGPNRNEIAKNRDF